MNRYKKTDSKIKIVLINHTFQTDYFYKRWKMLAEQHPDIEVFLFAPKQWTWGDNKKLTFGTVERLEGVELDEGNFHIKTIDMVPHKHRSWTSKSLKQELIKVEPDIIYHIGTHLQESLIQCIQIKKSCLKNAKVIAFSMRGPSENLKFNKEGISFPHKVLRWGNYKYSSWKVNQVNKNCKAIFCHYPDAVTCFRNEGYEGPIYMQTQVGVDTEVFFPNEASRRKIRDKYGIGDAYVFGSATRFSPSKGLPDVIDALPKDGNWKYLMMGSGTEAENAAIREQIKKRGLEGKIILTGFIDWHDMNAYWNAVDCAVHTPRTTQSWCETFSLALVQAMATQLPVIGNTSGSVPYQLGPDGIILEEGNIQQLHDQFVFMINNPDMGREIGRKMYMRATSCFSIQHLDDCFYDTIIDIYNDKYDPNKQDMATYRVD